MQVRHRLTRVAHMSAAADPALRSANQQHGHIVVHMVIGVAQSAANDEYRVIEQRRAVDFLRCLHSVEEVCE